MSNPFNPILKEDYKGKKSKKIISMAEGGSVPPPEVHAFLQEPSPNVIEQGADIYDKLDRTPRPAQAMASGLDALVGGDKEQAEGVEPTGSPIDFLPMPGVGRAAEVLAKPIVSATEAIANGLSHGEFSRIVGNEIGAVGKSIKTPIKKTVDHLFITPEGVDSPDLKTDAKNIIEKIKEKGLAFFNPEDPESFTDLYTKKGPKGDVKGALGLDEDARTLSIKVDPKYQGKGVASSLYKEALKEKGLLRSSTYDQQLAGGQGLWEKFEKEHPYHVREARDPDTLKPLPYRVWQADTNIPLRKKEMAIEDKVDALREKWHSTSENLKLNPTVKMLRDQYTQLADKQREVSDRLVDLARKHNVPLSELEKGEVGIIELDDAQYQYKKLSREKEAVHDKFDTAIKAPGGSTDPKQELEKEINNLLKQHKEIRKKSGHVLKAFGGLVSGGAYMSQDKDALNFADGGEVPRGTMDNSVPPEIQAFLADDQQQPNVTNGTQQPSLGADSNTSQSVPPEIQAFLDEDKNNEPLEQVKAGAEGLAEGVAGPLAPLAEKHLLGVKPEDMLRRSKTGAHTVGNLAGFAGSMLAGTGEAALIGKAGSAVAEGLGVSNRIGKAAVQAATEMGLLASGDELSKLVEEDPEQSLQTAAVNVGLSGLIGAVGGGALGSVHPLWEAAGGNKLGQAIEDFRGRMASKVSNPDPVGAITEELSNHYKNISELADDVYGPKGLKAQEIQKVIPELSTKMVDQAGQIGDKLDKSIKEMVKDQYSYPPRLTQRLQADVENYMNKITAEGAKASDIFTATEELKQTLQGYSKYDKFVKPVDEAYDFVKKAKSLSFELREALEDGKVWGKASERQKEINSAFKQFLPALKDFEKKFTVEVGGERTIDPGKINTYYNQLGKPNAEIKKEMLGNFLDASDKYKQEIAKTHMSLGLDSPISDYSLTHVRDTLGDMTPGAKLADIVSDKLLGQAGGQALGAGVGGALGHTVGQGAVGAFIGAHALGPFFSKALPALIKPMLEKEGSAKGLKSGVDYLTSIIKGDNAIEKGVRNLFKAEASDLPFASEKDTAKLDKNLRMLRENPSLLMSNLGNVAYGHYLPNHATAATQTINQAVAYLQGLIPGKDKAFPLDKEPMPSTVQKAEYEEALKIAQQPLIVLEKMRQGRITPNDVKTLSNVYPSLYQKMSQKLNNAILDHTAEGKSVPYKQKLGMAVFLAQPLDSTMTPMAIQTAQQQPQGSQQQQQAPPKEQHKTSVLNKYSLPYQTQDQARSARQNNK